MHSLFVKFASLAVMFHMTFGCAWHHGLGNAHACTNGEVKAECGNESDAAEAVCRHEEHHSDGIRHGEGEESHDGHRDQLPAGEFIVTSINGYSHHDHDHDHSRCEDDSCPLNLDAKPVVSPDKLVGEYLGGVGKCSLVDTSVFSASVFDPFPDCSHTGTKVRAHLLLGVLTL